MSISPESPITRSARRHLWMAWGRRAVAVMVTTALLTSASPAFASGSDSPTTDSARPDASQRAAIAAWESPIGSSASAAIVSKTSTTSASATSRRTTKLYRGSFLMWGEERVEFTFNGTKVISSSGYQNAGAVFPNNVTRHGTKKVASSSSTHSWRGQYTVGAGVPTPWGSANVYNRTSTARTDVKKNGAWSAWWIG